MKKPNEKIYFYCIVTKEKVKTIGKIKEGKVFPFYVIKKDLKNTKYGTELFREAYFKLRDKICPEVKEEIKKEFLDKANER